MSAMSLWILSGSPANPTILLSEIKPLTQGNQSDRLPLAYCSHKGELMGKTIALLVGILTVWGALAQIMPDVFQVRRDSKLKQFLWGSKSIWIAVMSVGCLLGWYIWILEGRLNILSSASATINPKDHCINTLTRQSPAGHSLCGYLRGAASS